jgi:hypothetical protein
MTYHHFLRDQRGTAALELVWILPLLFLILYAVMIIGDAAQRQIAIQSAVRAGGEYARFFPTDSAGIKSAITNALPPGWTLSGTPTVTCTCQDPNPPHTAQVPTSCSGIETGIATCNAPFLVIVSASMPSSSLTTRFPLPVLNLSFNNSANYEVRIQ